MREISEGEGTVRAIWRTLLSVNAFAYCATWGPEQRSREGAKPTGRVQHGAGLLSVSSRIIHRAIDACQRFSTQPLHRNTAFPASEF